MENSDCSKLMKGADACSKLIVCAQQLSAIHIPWEGKDRFQASGIWPVKQVLVNT